MKKVKKLWGSELWVINTRIYCGKILTLKRGWQCSLHYHLMKDETFYINKGMILLEIFKSPKTPSGVGYVLRPGEMQRIKPGTVHRFKSLSKTSEIIEFSTHHLNSDTVRIEKSCRIKTKKKGC